MTATIAPTRVDPTRRRGAAPRLPAVGRRPATATGGDISPRRSVDEEFTEFVTANYPRLRHIADLMIGGDHAEDLLQNVLIRLHQRWRRIDHGHLMGYVRTSLANARTDRWRRLWTKERPVAEIPEPDPVPDHAGRIAGRDAVQRALATLTRRERVVVVLRYYENLSEAETAETLGIAVGTVKSTCHRAMAKLRECQQLAPAAAPGTPSSRSGPSSSAPTRPVLKGTQP